ncbi:hypothetical protein EJ05DRAFT_200704 [Pseudovirgaria hyperparasitica]|uniref:Casparian strip membrane protein domain-containing protein n=1 Tax=Pseudovirgaria hyperparasitica TaxID=470096 RepID=A0A6A6WJV2_9PEZI|nr:uncharacterized protein EJ05DRAFT_200704 [Pseudovirgaria hyperparasitica]KAF2762207.1 hypothetical protein EJ05DRAFT_200704 [Pseudovirgaria hyperparasitica]
MATHEFNEKKNNLLSPTTTYDDNSPNRPQSGTSSNEKQTSSATRRSCSRSVSSRAHTTESAVSATAENRERQRAVRTLPPWVLSIGDDEDEDYLKPPGSSRAPCTPPSVRPASHHYTPQPKEHAAKGRAFDHEREGVPVTITTPVADHASKWTNFIQASTYGGHPREKGEVMTGPWMQQNMPDLEAPWVGEDQPLLAPEKGFWLFNPRRRKELLNKAYERLMKDPLVPALLRLWIIVNSAIALGLSGSIFHRTVLKPYDQGCPRGSSTYMAVIVDVLAIPYTLYITWDEYINKPLGLRPHGAKMRLLFMDLIFIVFDSANLSVAFESLTDPRWFCQDLDDVPSRVNPNQTCLRDDNICDRQVALTVILLLALLAWLATFTVSTLRVMDRAMAKQEPQK